MSWVPEYDDAGRPTSARWSPDPPSRPTRRCPRTWPHEAHGPWSTGEIVHPADMGAVSFDCPGISLPQPVPPVEVTS